MDGPIVVGFDGSPESLAAADWAAREALRCRLPLELTQAWPWTQPYVLGSEEAERWGRQRLAEKAAELRTALPGLEVSAVHLPDSAPAVLEAAGRSAAMLVLGSRGLGPFRGFLIGSVSQEVLGRAGCPVVLVRADDAAPAEHLPAAGGGPSTVTPLREVVLGLDLRHRCDGLVAFAFRSAALRSAPLRVVHAWAPPHGSEYLAAAAARSLGRDLSAVEHRSLADALEPGRERFPLVDVVEEVTPGSAAPTLLAAAAQAGLLVIGRRTRHAAAGPRLGPVAHAAIHHAPCPIAVVPYREAPDAVDRAVSGGQGTDLTGPPRGE
ncbi:universal stress protein [Kitasatospora sp. NPDC048540]|uniref:universal stress protein n=1 Tax=Kitasatospora sp. NPDC048540 TaxID=3155634 RepID=UPI0033F666F9